MLSKVSQTLSSEPVDVGLFTSVTGYFVVKGTESLEKGDQGLAYTLSVGFGLKTLSILLNIKNSNQNQSQSVGTQNNTISSMTNDAINQALSFIKSLNKSAAFNTAVFGLSTISFGIASYDAPKISDIVINSVITGALGVIALSTAYNSVAKNSETIIQTPINLETV
jgi:hypothetical protein